MARENVCVRVALKDIARDVLIDCKDIGRLRSLRREVVIITDLDLVRGVDYKTIDGRGLELLIARPLPSQRELKQLKGRVGRYGEACARYHLDTLSVEKLVNKENELTIARNISSARMF